MKSFALEAAKRLYYATPFYLVRELYFKCFLRLVKGRKIIAKVEGMTFDLDMGELIDVHLYLQRYERDVVAAIERLCQSGWTVLDIGANIGAHTLRFAKKVGPTGRVYAFEPTDFAYNKLVRNISLNPFQNIHPFQTALSDKNLKQQEINFRSSWNYQGRNVTSSSLVDFKRLDDFCTEHDLENVNMIKIDVDGNEFPILSGAQSLLERCRPIILAEVGSWHFKDPLRNPFEVLCRLNYHFYDTRSFLEYPDLAAIRKLLPLHDDENMTFSLNLVAMPDLI